MYNSISNSLKTDFFLLLNPKLGLNNFGVDKVISSSKSALKNTMAIEARDNGVETLLNLFSKENNSASSKRILRDLDIKMLTNLTSNGFASEQALSITSLTSPMIIELISKKINGDSKSLKSMLHSIGIKDIAKNKISSLFKNLYK